MSEARLTRLFRDELHLCKLGADETVGLITESASRQDYVEAALTAAADLGAAAYGVRVERLSDTRLPPASRSYDPRSVAAAISATDPADMVLDLTARGLVHSDVRTQILAKGKRMLLVVDPPDILERLFPTPDVQAMVEHAGDMIVRGSRLRVRSHGGTDLSADISGDIPVTRQFGYTDTPGRWDHWPSGFVACFPHDGSTQGTIVLLPGDVLLPFNRYVQSPTTLHVESGFIRDIEGDGADAAVLRDYFARWDGRAPYALSHIGWGVHPNASWAGLEVYDPASLMGQELRSVAGNFMFSTGPNRFANRDTPAHLDIPMRSCSVWVDDRCVVENGILQASHRFAGHTT